MNILHQSLSRHSISLTTTENKRNLCLCLTSRFISQWTTIGPNGSQIKSQVTNRNTIAKNVNTTTIPITTLVFDIDDTLYDISTGFTAHRINHGATSFMVHKLNFSSFEAADKLRDQYFQKYHSTAKALTVAEAEGKLPLNAPKFQTKDLSEWWCKNLDFTLLTKNDFQAHNEQLLKLLQKCPLKIIAFSNGPRKYAIKVLKTLGLYQTIFFDDKIFAVDDVLPYCKPEKEAFEHVFKSCGVTPNECIFIEDSMKNIRIGKSLGMKTILIAGMDRLSNKSKDTITEEAIVEFEESKIGDIPVLNDPTVDVVIETCLDMKGLLKVV